jgi:hypothetical protein
MVLHDQMMLWLLREYLDVEVPDLIPDTTPVNDLTPYVGTYRSNQLRVDVSVVDGQLEERMTYEPLDNAQKQIFTGFAGGLSPLPPRRFVPIRKDLFAPAGMPLGAFNGYSRVLLVSYHGISEGRANYRCAGGRMTRRAGRLRLGVLTKREIRAAADKELPQDHAPFDFSLLPDEKDEYIITGGVFKFPLLISLMTPGTVTQGCLGWAAFPSRHCC